MTPILLLLLLSCTRVETQAPAPPPAAPPPSIGDATRGLEVITRYGCQTCHVIPGVAGGGGMLGPALEHYGSVTKIVGKVPMTPDTLARYIENPPAIDPDTRMPPVGLTNAEARDAAAYLLSLK